MFEFIKKLTSRVVPIVAVEYLDEVLRFQPVDASKPLKMGELDVTLTLPGEVILKARLTVLAFEAEAQVYTAKVLDPPEARELLVLHYEPVVEEEEPQWEEKRAVPRLAKVCGTLSRDFPGFKGTSYDLTVEGARLLADGPLAEGHKLKFTLDLDDARLEPMALVAEVKWCKPATGRQHFIGVHFTEIGEKDARVLADFLKRISEREAGVIDRDYQL